MAKKVQISASIMCANWMNLYADLQQLEKIGCSYIHYDIMDGLFCQDYCLGFQIINTIRKHTKLASDYHLMVENPIRMLQNAQPQAGDIFTIHYEASNNIHRDIMLIKKAGFRPGLAINPGTPINTLEYILQDIDVIQIMMVNPGAAGQKIITQTLDKIPSLASLKKQKKLSFKISVDGNVNWEYGPKMISLGADILIGGSSGLFVKDTPLHISIKKLTEEKESKYHAAYTRD